MNHLEAVKGKLAESYVLGDLKRQQRDAYEEHYFGCPICATEVKLDAQFLANLKRVSQEEKDLWN
jgi:hypothetical protein